MMCLSMVLLDQKIVNFFYVLCCKTVSVCESPLLGSKESSKYKY